MSTPNLLTLKPGTRLRTGGTTYEVTKDSKVPAGIVIVVPQASRLLKVFCETCNYTARITQRWITKAGTPECPSGHGHMVVAAAKEKAEPEVIPALPPVITAKKAAKAKPVQAPEPDEVEDIPWDATPVEPESDEPSTLAALLADL